MIRLVLFDIDGTLIRTRGAGTQAFERAFASEFKISGATEKLSFAGRTDTSLVRECFRNHGIKPTPKNFRRFFENYVFWLDQLLNGSNGAPCPGVVQCLRDVERMASPPLLGLLTGNIRLGAEIKLQHYGLWNFFRLGAFGDDHENRNELAKIAQGRARRLLGGAVPGEQVLVVGDTPLDIECGRSIGAKVLAVATGGYPKAELSAHRPTWVVENLTRIQIEELCA
ncbi:MAG: HAD family hydrolase [Verrucomicrobia bacterium]|nr:HAD family hydrolase [Verrucomicrobiota bacterium]